MSKYNLYLLNEDSVDAALEKIQSRDYRHIRKFENHNVSFDMYMTKQGHKSDVWWIDQYAHFLPDDLKSVKNIAYSAMILAKTAKHNYIISMGKTHFYMNEFCDIDFGVDLAQRIGDKSKNKLKNSDYFGGVRNKAITSNTGYSELDFQSGESISFLKLLPVNKDEWGRSAVTFGASVQFSSIDVNPTELGKLLTEIDATLSRDSLFRLPRSTRVKNTKVINNLNKALATRINRLDNDAVHIFDYEQFGVNFLFSEDASWRLKYKGIESEPIDQIDLPAIKSFCHENGIDLETELKDIKLSVLVNNASRFTASLVNFFDYQDEGNYYLRGGRWYEFNQDFIDELSERMAQVPIESLDFDFSKKAYEAWAPQQDDKVRYRERYYNTQIAEKFGYILYDRVLDLQRGKKLEICDMYDTASKRIIITKRGEPIDLGYAIDQANTIVKLISHRQYQIEKPRRRKLAIHRVELLLVFKERTTKINSLVEINSLTFQTKVNDLFAACRDKDLVFSVTIAYEKEPS